MAPYGPGKARRDHAEIILQAARLCRERVEEMAVAMTLEQGKPIAQSRLEIGAAATSSNGTRPKAVASTAG
jgi:acyl-CoA reductase-like NAD-dependent aldehyde dehydrogenase